MNKSSKKRSSASPTCVAVVLPSEQSLYEQEKKSLLIVYCPLYLKVEYHAGAWQVNKQALLRLEKKLVWTQEPLFAIVSIPLCKIWTGGLVDGSAYWSGRMPPTPGFSKTTTIVSSVTLVVPWRPYRDWIRPIV